MLFYIHATSPIAEDLDGGELFEMMQPRNFNRHF